MPPKPILNNEQQRRWVIAGLMVLLLLGALVWAYTLSRPQTLTVSAGGLTFQFPGKWVATPLTATSKLFREVQILQQGGGLKLTIARFQPNLVKDMETALGAATMVMLGRGYLPQDEPVGPEPLSHPHLQALSWRLSGRDARAGYKQIQTIVILHDGQRYWAVLLSESVPARAINRETTIYQGDKLRDWLWRSATVDDAPAETPENPSLPPI